MLSQFILGLLIILALDLTYLSVSVPTVYKPGMGPLLKPALSTEDKMVAFAAWPLLVLGILYFAVSPAFSAEDAFKRGVFLGALVYGVYQLTNKSTLVFWGTNMMIIDWMWGSLLSGTVAGLVKKWT